MVTKLVQPKSPVPKQVELEAGLCEGIGQSHQHLNHLRNFIPSTGHLSHYPSVSTYLITPLCINSPASVVPTSTLPSCSPVIPLDFFWLIFGLCVSASARKQLTFCSFSLPFVSLDFNSVKPDTLKMLQRGKLMNKHS